MGLFDRLRGRTSAATVGAYPLLPATAEAYGNGGEWGPAAYALLTGQEYDRIQGMSHAEMWRTQPYLRTVVTFLARNIAQLGLQGFVRQDENDRVRVRDGIAATLRRPNPTTTGYELIYGLVSDLALFDRAYWWVTDSPDAPLVRLPVGWVQPLGGDAFGPEKYRVQTQDKGRTIDLDAADVLTFHGWHPDGLARGSSPVAALKTILAEQVQAARYREQVWKRGGKVGAVLSRPAGAPEWPDEARRQFKADWDSQFTGNGPRVGGTPLLEDGMTLTRVDFSAREMEFVEAARLALNTVASVYHVNPTMIGLLDNANYSNVREFRRMLYGDTLGPIISQIESRLNTFLVPRLDPREGLYVEFNVEEKLRGNFEEQTAAIQSAVGRPWMTANEARALRNMPALPDGDELVTPLNVLVGGQASPTDATPDTTPDQQPDASASGAPARKEHRMVGASPEPPKLTLLKAAVTDRQADQITAALARFFRRQKAADRYHRGTGDWDAERWDRELGDDLHEVALSVSATLGKAEARSLGYDAADYDTAATVDFLKAVAARRATTINETTKAQLDAQLAAEEGDPAGVYTTAEETRGPGIAVGLATLLAGFATHEAASQIAYRHDVAPTKTWLAGANPRPEHAQLDGETVPLGQEFSNGLKWPGDSTGDAADNANCNCLLQINLA